jgi:hypothetical protein
LNWCDVAGPPGCGKSTLCDSLWGPHELPIEDRLPPVGWHDFINEITRLFHLIRAHPTFPAAVRMNNRSVRKIATVARAKSVKGWKPEIRQDMDMPYIQTALVQRGLGFGWRMCDMGISLQELKGYFRHMPVSIGVVVCECDSEIIKERNHLRRQVPETAHEDRAHMVDLMLPAIDVALETLDARGIPIRRVSTDQPVDDARAELIKFAANPPCDAAKGGFGNQMEIFPAPPWWG